MAEEIAALVHAPRVTGLHGARILRTATDAKGRRLDLWPQAGSGARITSFKPSQLSNLLLTVSDGDLIRGPEVVTDFRSLRHPGSAFWMHTRRVPLNTLMNDPDGYEQTDSRFTSHERLLEGPTFGHDLDATVEALADPGTPANVREYLRRARVILTLAPVRAAKILIPMSDGFTQHIVYAGEQIPASSALYRVLEGSTDETTGVLEALAIMWRENQAALRPPPTSENRRDSSPWQGTNAAASSQPSATTREPGRPTPPVLSEREIALNRHAAGPPFTKERPNARYRQLSADPAGG